MKIAVYSIAKNEIDQVDSYMDHLDALGIKPYVLDHSTDGTTEKLRARGAVVDTTPIKPFWWDLGKNAAMDLCSSDADFCVNIDLDERLSEDFWMIVEQVQPETKTVQHLFNPDGKEARVRYDWRLHARHGARWTGPVHEYLDYVGEKKCQILEELLIVHWPPPHKNHVPVDSLLRAVKAFPDDIRIKALCGRELYFSGRTKEALQHFHEFLDRDRSGNELDQRYANTMLAKCYKKLNDPVKALFYFEAAAKFPCREAFVDLAHAFMERGRYKECLWWARAALKILTGRYFPNWNPECWTFKPHELAGIALYNLGEYDAAILACEQALALATGEDAKRIEKNLLTMRTPL